MLHIEIPDELVEAFADAIARRLNANPSSGSNVGSQQMEDPWSSPVAPVPQVPQPQAAPVPPPPVAPQPQAPIPVQAPPNSGTITVQTQNGPQSWTLNPPNGPMCTCGEPAAFVVGSKKTGGTFSAYRCAKGASSQKDGPNGWGRKCAFNVWA